LDILTKLCLGRAIGVYFSGEHVSITDVGITIKGLTTLNQQSFEVADGSLAGTLQEYVKNHGGRNVPVCLGLKPEQTFFITAGEEYGQQEQVRDKLLERAGFHSAEERTGVVADYFKLHKVKSHTGQLWSIGVCRKKLAGELYSAIAQAGFKDCLLKPTPWSMSLLSSKLPEKCKGWKVLVQVFLNETGGLAVLVVEKNPVCWKRFGSQPESVEKMVSAIRGIFIQSAVTFNRPMIDGIVLYGANAEQLSQKLLDDLGIEVVVADGPGFTDSYCSYSLAMSAKAKDSDQFDMFRELRPKPGIMKTFPWKIAAAIVFAAFCMAFTMWQKTSELARNCSSLKRQNSTYKWAVSKRTKVISKERQDLLAETEAVQKFISTRVIWSDYLRDLPTRLPPNVSLSNIWAMCEYRESGKEEAGGRKKTSRSLSLRGMTLFEKGKASPKEIESFLDSLRKVELLKRDFPQVQLSEIKWRREGRSEVAAFTVLALSKKVSRGGDEKDEKGGKGGKDGKSEEGG